jgi:hypothetical protein
MLDIADIKNDVDAHLCLKVLSNEIYLAERGMNRQVTLRGRGAEVFRGFCPSPLM